MRQYTREILTLWVFPLFALAALLLVGIVAVLAMATRPSRAAEPIPCQTPSPCKIIILSREEEAALVDPNQILDTATQGRPLDLMGKVNYFRDKIRNAPPGSNAPVESPK